MKTRRYGDNSGYWIFRGPTRHSPGNGTFYDCDFPSGTKSALSEHLLKTTPQITEEEIVLIRLSW